MPKYLFHASYTLDAVKGLHRETASSRRDAVEKACKSVGGKLDSFYFAFGGEDVVGILDMPDRHAVAALLLAAAASGAVRLRTTPLMAIA